MKNILNVLKNSLPRYSLTQPSTGKLLTYRPFTVKEEKSLLIAKDTGNYIDFLLTIAGMVDACFSDSGIKAKNLPIFDIEYLFLKLREKSVSEVVSISFNCPSTGERIKNAEVNLDELEVKIQDNPKIITISPDIIVNMRYPTYEFLIESAGKTPDGNVDLFDMVLFSIESIQTPSELITHDSMSNEFLKEFIDNLTRSQYEMILNFFIKSPRLEHEVHYKTEDGIERKIILKGLRDFFH
jgi:hypothetical protein